MQLVMVFVRRRDATVATSRLVLGLGTLVCAASCNDDGDSQVVSGSSETTAAEVGSSQTSEHDTTADSTDDGTATATSSATLGDTSSDSGDATGTETTTGTTAECGNGTLEGEEECDEGDANDNNGSCKLDCTAAFCGDTFLGPDEECDDSDGINWNACTNACRLPVCGDSIHSTGEGCDDGNDDDGDACTSACIAAVCGDGLVWIGMEECDDANVDDTDSCLTDCNAAFCGDGFVGPGEACDDGNNVAADGCTNVCALPTCGDGITQVDEACDDMNADESDACLSTCVAATCGDGHTWAGVEACDDANADNGDACVVGCLAASCGDGFVHVGVEACDDANLAQTDACLSSCAAASCGDGHLWSGVEICDDGNGIASDGCESSCTYTPGLVLWTTTIPAFQFSGDCAGAVVVDSDDEIVVGITHTCPEDELAKLDADGAVLWAQDTWASRELAVLSNDAIVATAFALSAGYDENGAETWNDPKPPGPTDDPASGAFTSDVAVDGNDVSWLVGYDDIGGGIRQLFVARQASDGSFIDRIDYPRDVEFNTYPQIAYDAGDGTMVIAMSGNNTSLMRVSRLASDASEIWSVTGSVVPMPTLDTVPVALAVGPDGSIVVSVVYEAFNPTYHVVKLDADGGPLWQIDTGSSHPNALAVDSLGNVVAAGTQLNMMWIQKWDPDGNDVWSDLDNPSAGADRWAGVAIDSQDNIVVAGPRNNASVAPWVRKYAP